MNFDHICIHCMKEKSSGGEICPFCGFDPDKYEQKSYVLPPRSILNGKYLVGEMLGAGGFGITYAALDLRLLRRVAIKEYYLHSGMYRDTSHSTEVSYSQDNRDLSDMVRIGLSYFEKEAMLLARVEELPGIVRVYEIFNENRTCYIVLEYLEGVTLRQYARRQGGRIAVDEVLDRFFPVMDSLAILHDRNILHRDISPDNIMVMENGGMKLFDFGGAKVLENTTGHISAMTMKKNGFSPLEQICNEEQGPWTDEYALAATMYFCITGTVPPDSSRRVLTEDPLVPPSAAGIPISPAVESAIMKAFSIRRNERYPDVRAFQAALLEARRDPFRNSGVNTGGRSGGVHRGEKPSEAVSLNKGGRAGKKKNPVLRWLLRAAGAAAAGFILLIIVSQLYMMKVRKDLESYSSSRAESTSAGTAAPSGTPSAVPSVTPSAAPPVTSPAAPGGSASAAGAPASGTDGTSPQAGTASVSSLYPDAAGVTLKASSYNEAAPDWTEYTELIREIKSNIAPEERVAKMHRAEDILMATGAVIPLYYYNDLYLQKTDVVGIYSNLFGFKYFQYAASPRDVLKINLASEPAVLDPALNSSVDGGCIIVNTFSGLYAYNAEGQLEPACADPENPCEVSEDGMTYTFHLRGGLTWSDGSPLTAADFEYAWKRAAEPETGADYGYLFTDTFAVKDGGIDVTAVDDQTLVARLAAPCAYFLDLTAFPAYYPVPKGAVEEADPDGYNPGAWAAEAGYPTNGAYTVSDWTHEESLVLRKNENWFDADKVGIEEIDMMLSADDTAIFAAYNAGDLDFADTVPANEVQSLSGHDDFHVVDNLGTYYAAFNVNSRLFEGKTVEQAANMRKAFSLLIDRGYITENVVQTEQRCANSFIPAGMSDGNGGEFKRNTDSYTYPFASEAGYYPEKLQDNSVDEAIALLESAGYRFEGGMLSDETPISVTYLTNEGSAHISIAEAMQQDLAEIGIDMSIEVREWNVFLEERKQGNFDFAREGWLADYNDPVNMLEMWTPESGNNDCQFGKS